MKGRLSLFLPMAIPGFIVFVVVRVEEIIFGSSSEDDRNISLCGFLLVGFVSPFLLGGRNEPAAMVG